MATQEELNFLAGELDSPIISENIVDLENDEINSNLQNPIVTQIDEVSLGDRLDRGVNLLQATGGKALQAAGEIVDSEFLQEKGREIAERNQLEADRIKAARELDDGLGGFLVDNLVEAVPEIGTILAGAGAGAAAGSVVPVIGTGVGALTGLIATSLGVNLGTAKQIEESLSDEKKADLGTAATALAGALFDVATGSVITKPAKTALKNATKKQLVNQIAKSTGASALTETGSTATLDIGATISADSEFDEDRLDAIAENAAASLVLGGILGGVGSAGSAGIGKIAKAQEDNFLFTKNIDGEDQVIVYNQEASKDPAFAKGNLTPDILLSQVNQLNKASDQNIKVKEFSKNFDITTDEFADNTGKTTVDMRIRDLIGEANEKYNFLELNNLRGKERKKLNEDLLNKKITPDTQKIIDGNRFIFNKLKKEGLINGDMGDFFQPFVASNDKLKKIDDNNKVDEVADKLTESAIKNNGKEANLDPAAYKKMAVDYINYLRREGKTMALSDGRNSKNNIDILKITDGTLSKDDAVKKLKNLSREIENQKKSDKKKVNKNNHIEQHRLLSEVDQKDLIELLGDENKDVIDIYQSYVNQYANRLAIVEKFGVNGEGVDKAVVDGHLESLEKTGQLMPERVVDKMYNLYNSQQGVITTNASPEALQRTRAAKTAANVITLPLATLSSLSDILLAPARTGAKSFYKGGTKALTTAVRKAMRKFFKDIKITDAERELERAGITFRDGFQTALARTGDDAMNTTKIDNALFKYNGLAPLTTFYKSWAFFAAQDAIKENGRILADKSSTRREVNNAARKMAQIGIDPNRAVQFLKDNGDFRDPRYKDILNGANVLVDNVVLEPKAAQKPAWQSNPDPLLSLISQLKTFAFAFNNRIAIPVINQMIRDGLANSPNNAAKLGVYATILYSGLIAQDALKEFAKTGDIEEWEDRSVDEHLARVTPAMGGLGIILDPIAAEQSFGGSATEALAGPVIGKGLNLVAGGLGDIEKVFSDEMEPEEALANMLQTIAPNLPKLPIIGNIREFIEDEIRN